MHRTQAEDDHSLQELLAKTVAAKERAETEGEKLGRQLRASVPAPRPVQPTILLPCPTTTTTTTTTSIAIVNLWVLPCRSSHHHTPSPDGHEHEVMLIRDHRSR
eukprot:COSAG01_NODE_3319_length_6269_cov_5.161264_6_plen_104_part_00